MYQCSKKLVKYKEYSCFDHSDFPAHSMFTSDVCWGSLGTSIFGNSSSAANNTWSRLPSRLFFRFLWLWCFPFIKRIFLMYFIDFLMIYVIWTGNIEDLTKFLNERNTQCRTIKLEYQISKTSITFLNTEMYLKVYKFSNT